MNEGETFIEADERIRYEAAVDTRKIERPRLKSRPIPLGWVPDGTGMLVHLRSGMQVENPLTCELDDADLVDLETLGADIAALASWATHERAFQRQEGLR